MVNNISHNGIVMPPTTQPNTFKRATITQIDQDNFRCFAKDSVGKEYSIPLHRPKGSGSPAIGELWMIERVPAGWVLHSLVNPPAPTVITGVKAGANTITLQLLAVLDKLGIVDDQTT